MSTTDARERTIADSQFGSGSPTTWYLALSTTIPADDGTNFTEPVGNSYTRVTITNNATNFPAASTSGGITTKTNGAKFTFPNPTGNWGTCIYYGFFTVVSGGTLQFYGLLDRPIAPKNGNTPVEFDVGELVMAWD